ncbi:Uncharacterised protein [Amycolatopsis camponoti]|uniref:Uncharacterized protein n=1 Tax=Amycolatopsis camponoti TaxID=2606593 RepID=A0A6I8M8J3_9PSEU|nr:Uncharacterised protein [Amycolatopsis camponoti]
MGTEREECPSFRGMSGTDESPVASVFISPSGLRAVPVLFRAQPTGGGPFQSGA